MLFNESVGRITGGCKRRGMVFYTFKSINKRKSLDMEVFEEIKETMKNETIGNIIQ